MSLPSPNKKSAFTLIELLTVIAIIAVLAAILIPAVGKVRESAHSAKCVSNLRSIGQTIAMYATENNGYYPWAVTKSYGAFSPVNPETRPDVGEIATMAGYSTDLYPEVEFIKYNANHIFNCPSSESTVSYRDYSLNAIVMGWGTEGHAIYDRKKVLNLVDPAKIILAADNGADNAEPANRTYFDVNNWPFTDNIGGRHNGKANVLFADYHIEAIEPINIRAEQIQPQP
jgi:prepilin-type N-terminal cleavage/methylation domain-containing protein/prepilin-type processing-associated H-X9-DG protein